MTTDVQAPLRAVLPGDSEMAGRMRAFDWSSTELGPVAVWPENLRHAVSLCLTSSFPMQVWWGAELTLLYNDAYIPFLGSSKHPQALGHSGRSAWQEIWDTIGPMFKSVFATGQATWSEDMLMFFDRLLSQEEVYATFSFSPVFGADGKVDGVFCACNETTHKIIATRRLETLSRLGQLAEHHSDAEACAAAAKALGDNPFDVPFAAIYLLDEARQKLLLTSEARLREHWPDLPASTSITDVSGTPTSPVIQVLRSGACLEVALDPTEKAEWPSIARQALLLPIHTDAHEPGDGVLVLGINTRRPLDAAYHTFCELVATHIGRELADARCYESERRRAEALAEIDRVKTSFFANVSHEFRTPITLMLGPLEDALKSDLAASSAEHAERLQLAHRNGQRLLKLVNTLLDFARLEAGRVSAKYQATDLAELTLDLVSNFRSACQQAGITLTTHCPPLLEPAHVDGEMWEKIILNLLSNAFKFTVRGEIGVELRQEDQHAHLIVTDTGSGIAAAELPRIFERFYRSENTEGRTREGAGIGLSLVRELVRLHRGEIWAESTLGQGSAFHVVIPLKQQISAGKPAHNSSSTAVDAAIFVNEALRWSPGEPTPDMQSASVASSEREQTLLSHDASFRVLIADDNRDMREYLQNLLSPFAQVDAVCDGEQALQALQAQRYDLLLADVMMPRLDGCGLLRHIRANQALHFMSVIVLSARAGQEARTAGLQAGADDYLIKPFSADELISRIGSCLALTRMRAQILAASEAAASESKQQLGAALAELQHRTRNLLGVIRSIATNTTHTHEFLQRLEALSRVHSLLSRLEPGDRVDFEELLRAELWMHTGTSSGEHDVRLRGPKDVRLRSSTVQTLALALHQLVSDAAEHGALAQSEAQLAVQWQVVDENGQPWLHIDWRESGVAERAGDRDPGSDDACRALIERALPYQLGARTAYMRGIDGLHCTIALPVSPDVPEA